MGERFFDLFMLPLERSGLTAVRKQLIAQASGRVLEIGAGTGANLPFYRYDLIEELTISDIELSHAVQNFPFPSPERIHYLASDVEEIPIDSNSIDCVVFTLVFCSVSNPQKGLEEIYRVLKPGGKVLFVEHVLPEEHKSLKWIFNFINPGWRRIANGCNVNRETLDTIREAGFQIKQSQSFFRSAFISGVGVRP